MAYYRKKSFKRYKKRYSRNFKKRRRRGGRKSYGNLAARGGIRL